MNDIFLSSLGLNANEIKVYKAVLQKSELKPTDLANSTGLKRTTAYGIAGSLVEKGLLLEDITKRPRTFVPASPEQVLLLIESEKKRVAERETAFIKLATELSNLSAEKEYPVPSIRFISEDKIATFLQQQTAAWNKSLLEVDPTWWGFQDHTYVEEFARNIEIYWKNSPKSIDLKLLTNLTASERKMAGKYERRYTKFWGEATNFISTTWIIGDYVVILNTRNHPFYLIEIHDKLMAHDQREIYRNLWELV